jgi:hypothetical protein
MLIAVVDTYSLEGVLWLRSAGSADMIVPIGFCVHRGNKKGEKAT